LIAVTGHEAADAKRQGDDFTTRLNQLEAATGKDKDAGLKAYTVVRSSYARFMRLLTSREQELGQADISTIVKSELRDRLALVRKAHDKAIKDTEAAATKAVRRILNIVSSSSSDSRDRLSTPSPSISRRTRRSLSTLLPSMSTAMLRFAWVFFLLLSRFTFAFRLSKW
jgi:hypothetical protein